MERLKYSCHLPRVEGGWVTVAQPSTETEEKVPGATAEHDVMAYPNKERALLFMC